MRLTVLGCAGTFPGPSSPCSAYLVESAGFRLLVDVGTGAIGALQRCGELLGVDAALVSHLHADHFLDLVSYSYARRYHPAHPLPPLPVFAPTGTRRRLCRVYEHPPRDGLAEVYDFRLTTAPSRVEIGPFAVDLALTNHPIECHGMRIHADGRTLAYSADSGESEALVELARDADVFLCEAAFPDGADNPPDIHLTGGQAGAHAARAGVGRLLLTHLVAWGDETATVDAASRGYPGPVTAVRSCVTYDI